MDLGPTQPDRGILYLSRVFDADIAGNIAKMIDMNDLTTQPIFCALRLGKLQPDGVIDGGSDLDQGFSGSQVTTGRSEDITPVENAADFLEPELRPVQMNEFNRFLILFGAFEHKKRRLYIVSTDNNTDYWIMASDR